MNRLRWMPAVLCVLVPAAAAAATSGPGVARPPAGHPLRRECALNLIEISKQLFAFASARDGMFPSKLSEAYAGAPVESLRALVCPALPPRIVPGGFRPSYAYVRVVPGGSKAAKGRDDILVYDAGPVHENGRNVLLADLETVAYMTEADLQAALAGQRERWAKQGKTLEVVGEDFIPLADPLDHLTTEAGDGERPPFFASVHFKAALAIVLAIGVVLVLLVLQRRTKAP